VEITQISLGGENGEKGEKRTTYEKRVHKKKVESDGGKAQQEKGPCGGGKLFEKRALSQGRKRKN